MRQFALVAAHALVCGCILAYSLFASTSVYAAGTVTEATEAALNAALVGGSLVTFACDGTILQDI